MLRRMVPVYLWIAPLMIVPLWYAYHLIGLRVGIACAAVHLVLLALGMWARGMLNGQDLTNTYGLARVLLTAGGGLVWALGASGPPRHADITLAFYNNIGLLSGLFVILLGIGAFKDELLSEKRGALASVGHVSFIVSFVVWALECFLMWVMLSAPAGGLPKAQRPDWFQAVGGVFEWIDSVRLCSVYIASAAFVAAGLLTGRINRWGAWVMLIFSFLGVGFGAVDAIPFFIPAVTAVVPYFLGVTLRRTPGTEAA
jgi:hypothetical protein